MTIATYFVGRVPRVGPRWSRASSGRAPLARVRHRHPDEARQAIGEYTEIPPDVLEEVVLPLWQTDLNEDSIELSPS